VNNIRISLLFYIIIFLLTYLVISEDALATCTQDSFGGQCVEYVKGYFGSNPQSMPGLCQYNTDCGARNAWGHWDLGYGNGQIPFKNSIIVLDRFSGLSTGHMAVVTNVESNLNGTFTLYIQESNWDNSDELVDCNVIYTFYPNDSEVTRGNGTSRYPVLGFIYGKGRPVIKFSDSNTAYLYSNDKLWPILGEADYVLLGFRNDCSAPTPNWSSILELPASIRTQYQNIIRSDVIPSANLVVKIVDKVGQISCMSRIGNAAEVYVYEPDFGGRYAFHYVPTMDEFRDLGKTDSDIVYITQDLYNRHKPLYDTGYDVWSAIYGGTIPEPYNLAAQAVSANEIRLEMDAPAMTTNFEISYFQNGSAVNKFLGVNGKNYVSVDNLQPNTNYCFEVTTVVIINGVKYESEKSNSSCATTLSSPAVQPPAISAVSVSSITQISAILSVTINPNGSATNLWFEWGTTTAYGNSTTQTSTGSGFDNVPGNAVITGLLPDTVYHYRMVAENSGGTTLGTDNSFRTLTQTSPSPYTLTVAKAGTGSGTVTSSPIGISCKPTCQVPFNAGEPVTLTAVAAPGSTFAGWSGPGSGENCSGTGQCVVTMTDENKQVIASFVAISYTLTIAKDGTGSGTITSSPDGIDCGADCAYSFMSETVVTITATANIGSIFMGWSGGGCSGTDTCTVSMNVATNVTATFAPIKGDINSDGFVDMTDLILVLQVTTGNATSEHITNKADVNEDGLLRLEEAIYILQTISGLR